MSQITKAGNTYSNLSGVGESFDLRTRGGGGSYSGGKEITRIADNMASVSSANSATDLQDALRRVQDRVPKQSTLPSLAKKGGVAGSSKTADASNKVESDGVSGTLTESSYSDRTFYDQRVLATSDGLFTFAIRSLKSIKLLDAKGKALTLVLKEKPVA